MKKWCAISDLADGSDQRRFEILNEHLKTAGVESEFSPLLSTEDTFAKVLERARNEFSQIRFSGHTGPLALAQMERLPSALLSLRTCDALVCDHQEWWPRFYLAEGLNQTLASEAATLDLGGSVLVVGAVPDARGVIAALSRIGFNKMMVTDPDLKLATALVEEMRRAYFGIQFQVIAREAVTQIPGICSIAVNTLNAVEDARSMSELAYFNFLKPNGFWLDLAIFPLNTSLQAEARSVGASILSGARVLAMTDALWVEAAFQVKIDIDAYTSSLSQA